MVPSLQQQTKPVGGYPHCTRPVLKQNYLSSNPFSYALPIFCGLETSIPALAR